MRESGEMKKKLLIDSEGGCYGIYTTRHARFKEMGSYEVYGLI